MKLFHGKIPPGNEAGSIPKLQVSGDGMWIPAQNAGISQGSVRILGAIQESQDSAMGWVERDFIPFQYPRLLQPGLEHSQDREAKTSLGIVPGPPSLEKFL